MLRETTGWDSNTRLTVYESDALSTAPVRLFSPDSGVLTTLHISPYLEQTIRLQQTDTQAGFQRHPVYETNTMQFPFVWLQLKNKKPSKVKITSQTNERLYVICLVCILKYKAYNAVSHVSYVHTHRTEVFMHALIAST